MLKYSNIFASVVGSDASQAGWTWWCSVAESMLMNIVHAAPTPTHLLLARLLLTTAIQYDDGKLLFIVVKYLYPIWSYQVCTDAHGDGFPGRNISPRRLVLLETFCSSVGKADSCYPMDLNVEFSNKCFEGTMAVHRGEATPDVLNRVSHVQDISVDVKRNFLGQFAEEGHSTKCRRDDDKYQEDVDKLQNIIQSPYDNLDRKLVSSRNCLVTRPQPSELRTWLKQ